MREALIKTKLAIPPLRTDLVPRPRLIRKLDRALAFLLNHLPPQIHPIIASRTEPPINLARLRGQAQLLELTPADLRFTAPEADEFLNGLMQLDLSPAERTTLEMRTEGWITGLKNYNSSSSPFFE